jgi:hypothetical protein
MAGARPAKMEKEYAHMREKKCAAMTVRETSDATERSLDHVGESWMQRA